MFENALKNLRLIDDKIIYALNTSIPTTSFKNQIDPTEKCHDLRQKVWILQVNWSVISVLIAPI